MSINIQPLDDFKLFLSIGKGAVNDHDLLAHVQNLNDLSQSRCHFNELADCRLVDDLSLLSTDGARISATSEEKKEGSKLAILVNDSPLVYALARAYEMFAEDKRQDIEIFLCESAALEWLGYNEEEVESIKEIILKSSESSVV